MGDVPNSPEDFASVFETAFARVQIAVEEASTGQPDWASRIAAAIRAGLEFAAADPAAAHVLANEAIAAGPDGLARYRRLTRYIAEALAAGRGQSPQGDEAPGVTEQALAGGLLGLIAERLTAGRAAELPALAPEAIEFALTPYLGTAEAKRVGLASRPKEGPER
jgi:AcrR family transcriptional regulator